MSLLISSFKYTQPAYVVTSGSLSNVNITLNSPISGPSAIQLTKGLWSINTSVNIYNIPSGFATIGVSSGVTTTSSGAFMASNISGVPAVSNWANQTGQAQRISHCNYLYEVPSTGASFSAVWSIQVSNGGTAGFYFDYNIWAYRLNG